MKRPTAKQIAARKLFSKRARAGEFARKRRKKNPGVRIVHNKLLGGWYVVTGPHQSPINGRFNSKLEAEAWLRNRKTNPKRRKNPGRKCTLIFSVKSPYTGKWTVHTRKEVDESRYATGHYERVKADLLAYARKYATNNEGYAVKVVETKSK